MVDSLSEEAKKLEIGIYKHYKGSLYEVVGVGHHTESEEELVFYKSLSGRFGFWARPIEMFCSQIDFEGKTVNRFSYLGACGSINSGCQVGL